MLYIWLVYVDSVARETKQARVLPTLLLQQQTGLKKRERVRWYDREIQYARVYVRE